MAEKRTIELEIQDNSKSLKQQYKEAVKELQNMVAAYGEMSDEAINAAKRAAELKDQIEDTNDLMKSFKGEGTFIAMGQAMSSVASGFSAIEGGLALVGVESEKIQETMLRVQAAMALAQGLEGLEDAGRAFSVLGTKAKVALQGIKTELIATGIGAFVVALGTAVAYWDDIKELATGVSKEQAEINLQLDKDIQSQEHKIDMLDVQQATLKLQGKSQKEINALVLKELNIQIAKEEQRLTAEKQKIKDEIESTKNYQNYLAWYIRVTLEAMGQVVRLIALPFDLMIGQINLVSEALGKGKVFQKNLNEYISEGLESASQYTSKLIFNADEVAAEGQKTIQEMDKNLATLKNKRDQLILDNRESDKNAAADRTNTERGAAQEQIDITRQMEEEKNRLMEEGRTKDLDAIRIKYKYEKEEADKNLKENKLSKENYDKLIKQQAESLELDTKAINDKYDKIELDTFNAKEQERFKLEDEQYNALQKLRNSAKEQELLELAQSYDAKFEAAKNNAELEKELTDQFNKDQAAIIKKYQDEQDKIDKENAEKKKAEIKALNEFRLNAAKDTLQMVSDLTELFAGKSEAQQKKAFQIQKAVNIANAVIDTYKAANAALASAPLPFNYIAMAATITAGLLNVKKIASQKFQATGSSGGGGGGSNAPAGAPMTANFSTIGSSGINQLAQLQQKPTQAYVVSGEVTSAQALDRNRVQNATL
jgi:hypothetical protein